MVPNNKQNKSKKGVRVMRPRSVSRSRMSSASDRVPRPVRAKPLRGSGQPTELGALFRDGGAGVGAAIGGAFGMPTLGGTVGRLGGALLSKLTGNGDYKVNTNSILAGTVPTLAESGSVRISNRECLGEISTSSAFSIQKILEINPGLSSTFPVLSSFGRLFEKWRLRGCVITFESTSAQAVGSTNTALGSVIIASEYQVGRSNPSSLTEMLAMKYMNQAAPYVTQVHGIECDGSQNITNQYITRTGGVPSGQDQHFFDPVRVIIATQGSQAVATAGLLYISYDIELINVNITGSSATQWVSAFSNTGLFTDYFAPPAVPLGSLTYTGPAYATVADRTITFQTVGDFYISNAFYCDAPGGMPGFNVSGGTVPTRTIATPTYSGVGPNYTRGHVDMWVRVTAVGQTVTVATAATPTLAGSTMTHTLIVPDPYSNASAII